MSKCYGFGQLLWAFDLMWSVVQITTCRFAFAVACRHSIVAGDLSYSWMYSMFVQQINNKSKQVEFEANAQ